MSLLGAWSAEIFSDAIRIEKISSSAWETFWKQLGRPVMPGLFSLTMPTFSSGPALAEATTLLINVPSELLDGANLAELGWKVYPD